MCQPASHALWAVRALILLATLWHRCWCVILPILMRKLSHHEVVHCPVTHLRLARAGLANRPSVSAIHGPNPTCSCPSVSPESMPLCGLLFISLCARSICYLSFSPWVGGNALAVGTQTQNSKEMKGRLWPPATTGVGRGGLIELFIFFQFWLFFGVSFAFEEVELGNWQVLLA